MKISYTMPKLSKVSKKKPFYQPLCRVCGQKTLKGELCMECKVRTKEQRKLFLVLNNRPRYITEIVKG